MSDHADTIRRAIYEHIGAGDAEAALDELVVERQQAIDERDAALAALKDELQWDFGGPGAKRIEELEARCEQAIDALREAQDDLERILPPRGHEELAQGVYFAHKRIDAALVNLGEGAK